MKLFSLIIFLVFLSCSNNQSNRTHQNINDSTVIVQENKSTLEKDITKASQWLVDYFKRDNKDLDYSLYSIKLIDSFFDKNSEHGIAKKNSLLSDSLGYKLFAIGSYIGEVIIKNTSGSEWLTNDSDPEGELNIEVLTNKNGHIWPVQKTLKRFKNGEEDSLYPYAYMVLSSYSK